MHLNKLLAQTKSGAMAGSVATLAMSISMIIGQRFWPANRQPPKRIVDVAASRLGLEPIPEKHKAAAAVTSHFGYGSAAGALFAAIRPRVAPPVVSGIGYALAVWLVSYKGWLPFLRIMPPPEHDNKRRVATMVAAHVVYGSVLGALVGEMANGKGSRATSSFNG